MATRNTRQEAEELLAQFQAGYPEARFIIRDRSGIRQVGKRVAEERGLTVLREVDGWMVVDMPAFDVLEVRTCKRCGADFDTAAIGEYDRLQDRQCLDCAEATREEARVSQAEATKRTQREVEAQDARDEHEEPGSDWQAR